MAGEQRHKFARKPRYRGSDFPHFVGSAERRSAAGEHNDSDVRPSGCCRIVLHLCRDCVRQGAPPETSPIRKSCRRAPCYTSGSEMPATVYGRTLGAIPAAGQIAEDVGFYGVIDGPWNWAWL